MANILKVVVFFLPLAGFKAQDTIKPFFLHDYTGKMHELNNKGMIVLTTWASANIISGTACFITRSEEEKYFYGMNTAWGAVNLAIAIPGLTSKKPVFSDKQKLLEKQLKTERIFLINGLLDVLYIGAGFGLKEVAKNQTDIHHRAIFSGFGSSFIVQGAGLLVFDAAMFGLNKRNRKKHLDKLHQNTEISFHPKGIHLKWRF